MKREGWEKILFQYLEKSRDARFVWGENDCCLWVGKFVDLMQGTNHVGLFYRKYKTAAGAAKIVKKLGFGTIEGIPEKLLTPIELREAKRGDIVLHQQNALGICAGRKSYFLQENGLIETETLKCKKAWEI